MRIAAVPAFRNRDVNPYNALLYGAVQAAGIRVEEFGATTLIAKAPDIVHVHWPEWLFGAANVVRARAQGRAFRAAIVAMRQRGARIVWTVHNLDGHHGWQPNHEQRLWNWFVHQLDGWIALSDTSAELVRTRYPHLRHLPHAVIPHGHYRGVYPATISRDDARDQLGIGRGERVIGFVGGIQPYKQVPHLVRTFRSLEGDDLRLVIAGKSAIDDHVAILAGMDHRVMYRPGFVPDDQLQVYQRAADVMVLPYRKVLNSGSAVLALSMDRPVLVPAQGSMVDLQRQVGASWVRTYQGGLEPVHLQLALDTQVATPAPDLSAFEWQGIGEATIALYRTVANSKQRPLMAGAVHVRG